MIKILLNTLLGLVLIFIWSRFVDLTQIINTLSDINLAFVPAIFFFLLLSLVIRAIRLKIFLAEVKNVPLLDLIFLNGAAMMLNFFIPIRAGEIAKGVYLNAKYQLELGKSITWVFLDRFVDFLAVLLLATILFFLIPTTLSIMFITIIIIILFIGLSLTYLAIFNTFFAKKLVSFLKHLFIVKSIKIQFENFSHFILQSFSILNRHPKDLGLMIILTILAYGADAAIWYFTFKVLGVSQDYLRMYLGQMLSALSYLIPAAPGYVGSAEASGLLILSGVFGINTNLASAMVVLSHLLSAIFILGFGLISIFFLKLDLRLIFRKVFTKKILD